METIVCGPGRNEDLNGAIGAFVSFKIWGQPGRISKFRALGVFDAGTLIAGVLYHNHYPEQGVVELTSAASHPRWLKRRVLRQMFEYPFIDLNCQMIVLRVAEDNAGLNRMLPMLGFDRFVIPRLRGRHKAELIFTLTDDDWAAGAFCSPAFRRRMLHGKT